MHSRNPWLAAFLQPLYRDLRAFVFINMNTQSPWLLRRSLRIDARSEPLAIAAVFLQPLYRDLRAFVFITQSPWRRCLRSDAQSDSFPVLLQVRLPDNHHWFTFGAVTEHALPHTTHRGSWIVDRTLYNVDCRLSIAHCTMWIVDCRSHIAQCGLSIVDCRLWIVDCR